jgi:hypothetical protein
MGIQQDPHGASLSSKPASISSGRGWSKRPYGYAQVFTIREEPK